jgi:hypothetical protein
MIENNTPLEVEDRWLIWLREGQCDVLDEDKDPKYYKLDVQDSYVEGEYFKQYNLNDYSSNLRDFHEYNKLTKKKLVIKHKVKKETNRIKKANSKSNKK